MWINSSLFCTFPPNPTAQPRESSVWAYPRLPHASKRLYRSPLNGWTKVTEPVFSWLTFWWVLRFIFYHTLCCSEYPCTCRWPFPWGKYLWVQESLYFKTWQNSKCEFLKSALFWLLDVFPLPSEKGPKSPLTLTSCMVLSLPVFLTSSHSVL